MVVRQSLSRCVPLTREPGTRRRTLPDRRKMMPYRAILLTVLCVTGGCCSPPSPSSTRRPAPAVEFFGKDNLQHEFDAADIIVTGKATSDAIGISHGGVTRWNLAFQPYEVIKGSLSSNSVRISIVTPYQTDLMKPFTGRSYECILFLTKDLKNIDPWFAVQPLSSGMVWALKQCAVQEDRKAQQRRSE